MVGVGGREETARLFPPYQFFLNFQDHIHTPPVLWCRQYFSLNPLSFELNTCKMLISLVLCHCNYPINSFLKSFIEMKFMCHTIHLCKVYSKMVFFSSKKQSHRYREQTSGHQWGQGSGESWWYWDGKRGGYNRILWNYMCETFEYWKTQDLNNTSSN